MEDNSIFVDSDVFIDIGTQRVQYFKDSLNALQSVLDSSFTLCTSSLIVSNIFYIISKELNQKEAQTFCEYILDITTVLPFASSHIKSSFSSDFKDKEDGFNYLIAKENKCKLIITRNVKDFNKSRIPVKTPKTFLTDK